jgi:hypothetical protein
VAASMQVRLLHDPPHLPLDPPLSFQPGALLCA